MIRPLLLGIERALSRVSLVAAGAVLWIMVTSITGQIAGRAIGLSVVGADEIATYAMVGLIFFGLAHTQASGAHIRVELLIERLEGRARLIGEVFAHLVALGFVGFFTAETLGLVERSVASGARTTGLLSLPLAGVQSVVLVGLALYLAALVTALALLLAGERFLPETEVGYGQ